MVAVVAARQEVLMETTVLELPPMRVALVRETVEMEQSLRCWLNLALCPVAVVVLE